MFLFKLGGFLHTKRTQTWAAQLNGDETGGSVDYGIYGVAEASWFYFGKDPRELSLPEAATIATP